MTAPIQQPSTDRALQGIAYQRDQLLRRPPLNNPLIVEQEIKLFADAEAIVVGGPDGLPFQWMVSPGLGGTVPYEIVYAYIYLTTVDTADVQATMNHVGGNDIFSTPMTIDAGEDDSSTASVPAVLDAAEVEVAQFTQLNVEVLDAGDGVGQGLGIVIGYQQATT